jgi:hypothetical protein
MLDLSQFDVAKMDTDYEMLLYKECRRLQVINKELVEFMRKLQRSEQFIRAMDYNDIKQLDALIKRNEGEKNEQTNG